MFTGLVEELGSVESFDNGRLRISHTSAVTTLGSQQSGDLVNIEVDVIDKYVERMLRPHLTATASTGRVPIEQPVRFPGEVDG